MYRTTALIVSIIGLVLVALLVPVWPAVQAANDIVFVRPVATGTGDGSSWVNATTLQDALQNRVQANDRDEIWVAQGTHYPTTGSDRNASFDLVSGVAVYGGFAGDEINRNQRDWEVHETILSGDIGTLGIASDNSYHVVTGGDINSVTILDGFTITQGNADSSSVPSNRGGGVHLDNFGSSARTSPQLANLRIQGNASLSSGGGIYCGGLEPDLTNVIIMGNTSSGGGGGLSLLFCSATMINVTIAGNTAGDGGGGISTTNASPVLVNVLISGNKAGSDGGGMQLTSGIPALTNVTISGNEAGGQGGGVFNSDASFVFQNSIVWGNQDSIGGDSPTKSVVNSNGGSSSYSYSLIETSGGSGPGWQAVLGDDLGNNLDSDPLFVSPQSASNAPTNSGDYKLRSGSPAINVGNNSVDIEPNVTGAQALPTNDRDGNFRFQGGTVDLGAYEYQLPTATPTNTPQPTNTTVPPTATPTSTPVVVATLDDLTVSVSDETPPPDDQVQVDVTLSSTGTLPVTLTAQLPPGLSVVTDSLDLELTYDPTTHAVHGVVEVSQQRTIRYDVQVAEDVLPGTILTHFVQASAGETEIEGAVPLVVPNQTSVNTLMLIYYVADNDLAPDGVELLNRAEQASGTPNAIVLMLLDGPGTDDAFLYRLKADTDLTCPSYANPDCGGRVQAVHWTDDTATDVSLAAFLQSATLTHPNAEQIVVSLIGHGSGVSSETPNARPRSRSSRVDPLSGLMSDQHPVGQSLSTAELGIALQAGLENTGRERIDGLYLDACLMGMLEVAYEIRNSVDYVLFSPHIKWAFPEYDQHIDAIDGERDARGILSAWIENETAALSDRYGHTYTILDLTALADLVVALDDLLAVLNPADVAAISGTVDVYDDNADGRLERDVDVYLDLPSFLTALSQSPQDTQGRVQAVTTALDSTIITSTVQSGPGLLPGVPWSWETAGGLSLYAPFAADDWTRAYYTAQHFQFSADSQWDEFLDAYWQQAAPPEPLACEVECGVPAPLARTQVQGVYLPWLLN